jgi:hypothetical protein
LDFQASSEATAKGLVGLEDLWVEFRHCNNVAEQDDGSRVRPATCEELTDSFSRLQNEKHAISITFNVLMDENSSSSLGE